MITPIYPPHIGNTTHWGDQMTISESPDSLHFSEAPNVETAVPGPKSRRLLDRQEAIDSSAVAYPKEIPFALDEARGATIRDVDGNTYLDFFAGIGVLNVGHGNPYVLEGVENQLGRFVHTVDFPTEARIELIEKLNEIAPGSLSDENRVIFGGPTGSDAIEGSIKLAKYNTGGTGLIAFRGAYHGSTAGALSLTAAKKYKKHYTPLLPDTHHVPYPKPFDRKHEDDAPSVNQVLRNVRELVEDPYSGLANPAGIWIEPIQGESGVVEPPEGFLPGLKEIATGNDIPLIVDEIQSGFGRTGQWFASDWYDVTPDIMPMAKGLGGIGLPLSASMYHEDLDTWEPAGHMGTFRGHVPAMVAGARAIEYIQDHDLLAHAQSLGSEIRDALRDAVAEIPHATDVRGQGLFIGVEFRDPDGNPDENIVSAIREYCYERGVLVWSAGRYSQVLRLLPPLVITHEQARTGLEIITDAIQHCANEG